MEIIAEILWFIDTASQIDPIGVARSILDDGCQRSTEVIYLFMGVA